MEFMHIGEYWEFGMPPICEEELDIEVKGAKQASGHCDTLIGVRRGSCKWNRASSSATHPIIGAYSAASR